MSAVRSAVGVKFDVAVPVLIVGAGAGGLCAALAAKEAGAEVVIVERDAVPAGSTALSAGLVPAAGTRFQRAKGIIDSPQAFAADIQRKAKGEADPVVVEAITAAAGALIEWLADRYDLPFEVISNFNYPGHSAMRMHGLPSRSGLELINRLRQAVETSGVPIICGSSCTTLFAEPDGRIGGVETLRKDDAHETIACRALVLACNGYGGNPELVRRFIPEMADALYFGHPGNRGDAVIWGKALGAKLSHLGAYQGHGSVATPHNILITWAVIMEGGVQLNVEGRRFCNEALGYSEQAAEVLRQPGAVVWNVFDSRIASIAEQFEDFRAAEKARAILTGQTTEQLAAAMKIPADALAAELAAVEELKGNSGHDRFGRQFTPEQRLAPPYHAVKVTGALFHTQGGLAVDATARVRRENGGLFPNLFAAGGAATGVSGHAAPGYLSGNGLLTATVLGRLAGQAAASSLRGGLDDLG
jgi:fumarate reductase flavoprotein subunit